MWDVRTGSPTLEIFGHRNSRSLLNATADKKKQFLFAGGEDGFVRAWDLRSGDILLERDLAETKISHPSPAVRDESAGFAREETAYAMHYSGRYPPRPGSPANRKAGAIHDVAFVEEQDSLLVASSSDVVVLAAVGKTLLGD